MFNVSLTSYGQTLISSLVVLDGIFLIDEYIQNISSIISISSYTVKLEDEACGNISNHIGNIRIRDNSSSSYTAKTILFYVKDGNNKRIVCGYSQDTALIQKDINSLFLFLSLDFSVFTNGFLFSSIQAGMPNASYNNDGIVHIENPDTESDDSYSVYSKVQVDGLIQETSDRVDSLFKIIPRYTSDLENDSGFITDIDIPTKLSSFTNDVGYITSYTETDPTVPSWAKQSNKPSYTLDDVVDGSTRKLSDYVLSTRKINNISLSSDITLTLDNILDGSTRKLSSYELKSNLKEGAYVDVDETTMTSTSTNIPSSKAVASYISGLGYATISQIPTTTSQLTNNSGYITSNDIPTDISSFNNDVGYLTSFTETDPTVPSWAKQSTKPTYTASEVGALPSSTVIPTVNNSTITIKKNTSDTGNSFTTNASTGKTINLGLSTVASTGSYEDLQDTPTNISEFTNDVGYLTSHQSLAGLVASVSYNDNYNLIEFLDIYGDDVSQIDATPFTKDGMIDSVSIALRNSSHKYGSIYLDGYTDQKIEVIKIVKNVTGLSLSEAKDLVEGQLPVLLYEGEGFLDVYNNTILGDSSYNADVMFFSYVLGETDSLVFVYNNDANKQDIVIPLEDFYSGLSNVALSGDYTDLVNTPNFYSILTNINCIIKPEESGYYGVGTDEYPFAYMYAEEMHADSFYGRLYGTADSSLQASTARTLSYVNSSGSETVLLSCQDNNTVSLSNNLVNIGSNTIRLNTLYASTINAYNIIFPYGYCTTPAGTSKKIVLLSPSVTDVTEGMIIVVRFSESNTSTSTSLSINNGTSNYYIRRDATTNVGNTTATSWRSNEVVLMRFDGEFWIILNFNTDSYSSAAQSNNYNILPATNETYDLGSTSYRWNKTYTKYIYFSGNNTPRMNLYSGGIDVYGHLSAGSSNTYDLGNDSYPFRNIYGTNITLTQNRRGGFYFLFIKAKCNSSGTFYIKRGEQLGSNSNITIESVSLGRFYNNSNSSSGDVRCAAVTSAEDSNNYDIADGSYTLITPITVSSTTSAYYIALALRIA